MNEKPKNAPRTDQEWMVLIQECRASGLGDKTWCEQHGIPISSFYSKITKLRKKACEIPAANHRVIRECQQVVPLSIIDEVPRTCGYSLSDDRTGQAAPAVILKTGSYCIEISNHAARETILNTLSVLQHLC